MNWFQLQHTHTHVLLLKVKTISFGKPDGMCLGDRWMPGKSPIFVRLDDSKIKIIELLFSIPNTIGRNTQFNKGG